MFYHLTTPSKRVLTMLNHNNYAHVCTSKLVLPSLPEIMQKTCMKFTETLTYVRIYIVTPWKKTHMHLICLVLNWCCTCLINQLIDYYYRLGGSMLLSILWMHLLSVICTTWQSKVIEQLCMCRKVHESSLYTLYGSKFVIGHDGRKELWLQKPKGATSAVWDQFELEIKG